MVADPGRGLCVPIRRFSGWNAIRRSGIGLAFFAHPPRRAADQRGSGMAATLQALTQQLELTPVLVLDIPGSSPLPVAQQAALIESLPECVHCPRELGRAQAKDQITEVPSGDGM